MTNAYGEPIVEPATPAYRPLVGAGAAAAYEALRHDFYVQKQKAAQRRRRMSSLSLVSNMASRRPVNQEE